MGRPIYGQAMAIIRMNIHHKEEVQQCGVAGARRRRIGCLFTGCLWLEADAL
jgi:hypothetical protein